jgi:predicted component of viral defense system (DUF524 family)
MTLEVERVAVRLKDDAGRPTSAELVLAVLPSAHTRPTISTLKHGRDLRSDARLLESTEYRYGILTTAEGPFTSDRPEVLAADDSTGRAGRLKTGLFTGTLPIRFWAGGTYLGRAVLDIASRKLDYERQYRWMLRDIASLACELVLQRFGTSEQLLALDASLSTRSLYQRFAFLDSLLANEAFVASLHRIVERPYVSWEQEPVLQLPTGGSRGSSQLARALCKSGPKHEVGLTLGSGQNVHLPLRLQTTRAVETVDNVPNQFVLFALERWREDVAFVREAMESEADAASRLRGLAESSELLSRLDDWIESRQLRGISRLSKLPSTDQVLQKRAGYRDVFRAFIESQLAARLSWDGAEDVHGAGKKDVAKLYEYWTFIQLARICSLLCSDRSELEDLVSVDQIGLSVRLRSGTSRVLRGELTRNGRRVGLELWFNKSFEPSRDHSWTRSMRPDCSIRLEMHPGVGESSYDLWIHFDAKYRADKLRELIDLDTNQEDSGTDEAQAIGRAVSKRDDLLKMHAYRDAIRRTAGAYVLYPGTEDADFRQYHEILPGLGAFALQPEMDGTPRGALALSSFLSDVIDHATTQTTNHERAEFWQRTSYAILDEAPMGEAVSFLSAPPADVVVLAGFVRGAGHWEWIDRNRRYNLRCDGRRGSIGLDAEELAAQLILLYDKQGAVSLRAIGGRPEIWSRAEMLASGYREPRSHVYFCLPMGDVMRTPLPTAQAIMTGLRGRWPDSPAGRPRALAGLTSRV